MGRRRKSKLSDKTVFWNDHENGKRVPKQLGFGSAREGKRCAEELSARMTLNLIKPDITPIRLQDAAAEFLKDLHDTGLALATRKGYATTLRRIIRDG